MIVILFRILLFAAILFILYSTYTFFTNPKRKLDIARKNKDFYVIDEEDNVKKNFVMTYKGVLFEGEKYLGATEQSFDVVTITVWTMEPSSLRGISKEDLFFLEKEILIRYPNAKIEWKHPIKHLLH